MLVKAAKDFVNFFLAPIELFVGHWAWWAMSIFILTSAFACGMAFHNTAARYIYSLAREGVLPSALGGTHDTFKSPHIASIVADVPRGPLGRPLRLLPRHRRPQRSGLPRRLYAARNSRHHAAADPAVDRLRRDHRLLPQEPRGRRGYHLDGHRTDRRDHLSGLSGLSAGGEPRDLRRRAARSAARSP